MTEERSPETRPHPNATPCADCGHVWFAGERQHVYVEVDGPPAAGEEEVICVLCRQVRKRPPSEQLWSW